MANNSITVVMATYNGSDTISEVLEGYTKLVSPTVGHDFVIVDNGSFPILNVRTTTARRAVSR